MERPQYIRFSAKSPAGEALLSWWSSLEKDRGDRARLCRCSDLIEVVFVPAYHRLFNRLRTLASVDEGRLPAVVGLLAHVRNDLRDHSFATQMALPKTQGGNARVSGLRFRRLLRCRDQGELFPSLIRAVRLLDRKANICDLAQGIYLWNDDTRKNWAYEYYVAAPTEK